MLCAQSLSKFEVDGLAMHANVGDMTACCDDCLVNVSKLNEIPMVFYPLCFTPSVVGGECDHLLDSFAIAVVYDLRRSKPLGYLLKGATVHIFQPETLR